MFTVNCPLLLALNVTAREMLDVGIHPMALMMIGRVCPPMGRV